jgi:hypothetical protein
MHLAKNNARSWADREVAGQSLGPSGQRLGESGLTGRGRAGTLLLTETSASYLIAPRQAHQSLRFENPNGSRRRGTTTWNAHSTVKTPPFLRDMTDQLACIALRISVMNPFVLYAR